jgi:hypothetical protein
MEPSYFIALGGPRKNPAIRPKIRWLGSCIVPVVRSAGLDRSNVLLTKRPQHIADRRIPHLAAIPATASMSRSRHCSRRASTVSKGPVGVVFAGAREPRPASARGGAGWRTLHQPVEHFTSI